MGILVCNLLWDEEMDNVPLLEWFEAMYEPDAAERQGCLMLRTEQQSVRWIVSLREKSWGSGYLVVYFCVKTMVVSKALLLLS